MRFAWQAQCFRSVSMLACHFLAAGAALCAGAPCNSVAGATICDVAKCCLMKSSVRAAQT